MKLPEILLKSVNTHDVIGVRAYLMNEVGYETLTVDLIEEVRRLMPEAFDPDDGRLLSKDKDVTTEKGKNAIWADLRFNFSFEKLVLLVTDKVMDKTINGGGLCEEFSETSPDEGWIGDLGFFQALGAGFRAGKSEFQRRWRH